MKDILITVISVLLTAVIIICMAKGLTVGNFHILSINDIKKESLNLNSEIDELNNLKNVTYKKKIDDLAEGKWTILDRKSRTNICNGILME